MAHSSVYSCRCLSETLHKNLNFITSHLWRHFDARETPHPSPRTSRKSYTSKQISLSSPTRVACSLALYL